MAAIKISIVTMSLFVIFSVLILGLYLLISEKLSWRGWYLVLLISFLFDIGSTYFLFEIVGTDWKYEMNFLVGKYGNEYGHINILFINHSVLACIYYLIGLFTYKYIKQLVPIFLYFFLSIFGMWVGIVNITAGLLKIIDL